MESWLLVDKCTSLVNAAGVGAELCEVCLSRGVGDGPVLGSQCCHAPWGVTFASCEWCVGAGNTLSPEYMYSRYCPWEWEWGASV